MRHDDQAPDLPDGRPYPGYDGPLGFADVDGGYPVDVGDSTRPPDEHDDEHNDEHGQARPHHPQDRPGAARPGERRLHNPLPPAQTADDDDWYDADPPSTDWGKVIPIAAVLAVAVGLGVWLAIPSAQEQAAPPATPTPSRRPTRPPQHLPATVTATARPTPIWTPTTGVPSTRTATPTRSSSPAASSTQRPPATPPVTPPETPHLSTRRPQPTVTVTKTMRATVKPSPTWRDDGPQEPPGSRPSTGAPPSPSCVTWGDCHDGPPEG